MFEILAKVIALGIASAASPGILAITVSLLAGKDSPVKNVLAFTFGGVFAALFLVFAGSEIWGGALTPDSLLVKHYGNIDVALGIVFILVGLAQLLPASKEKSQVVKKHGIFKLILLGFVINITNFDAVLFNLAALREIILPDISVLSEFLLILLADLFFLSPSLVPLAIYLMYPSKTKTILEPLDIWLKKHGRYVIAGILLVIGVWLISA